MGPLSRDHDVRIALGLAPSTLRALIADGARAGIAPPFAGAGEPEPIIGALVGHAGSTTRDTYIDPASLWSAMVEAVAKIPPVGVPTVSSLDTQRRKAAQE